MTESFATHDRHFYSRMLVHSDEEASLWRDATASERNTWVATEHPMPQRPPLAELYEANGAVWLADRGYWSLNGLDDITNEEILQIWNLTGGKKLVCNKESVFMPNYIRTNFKFGSDLTLRGAYGGTTMKVIAFTNGAKVTLPAFSLGRVSSLERIEGEIELLSQGAECFYLCYNIQHMRVKNLNITLDLHWCPLDAESAEYMIRNAACTAQRYLKLNAATYNSLSEELLDLAASKMLTVTSS